MLKNECTRNCWLAAAVAGFLVFLFNLIGAGFLAGLVLGLITFFLGGKLLIWLLCEGRGGVAESAEVLSTRATAHDIGDGGVLDRAEDAIVHAGNAFAAGTVSAVEKGREALHDMREEMREDREKMRREHDDRAKGIQVAAEHYLHLPTIDDTPVALADLKRVTLCLLQPYIATGGNR